MGNITGHFNSTEFVVSKDYPKLAAETRLTERDMLKLWYLCSMLLEPIRSTFDTPLIILSGKRSPELNRAVGGAVHSDHLFDNVSAAVDFTTDTDIRRIWVWASSALRTSFGQLVYYPKRNFIHISMPTPKHLYEVKTL